MREEGFGFLWVLAAFVIVAAAIAWTGRHFAARAAADPELSVPAEAVAHPVAAGILVALSLTSWFLPMAPAVFTELSILVALPSLLLLAGKVLPAAMRAPLYGFTALFGVTRFAAVLPESSLAGRLLILLVAIVALAGTFRLLRKGAPWTQAIARPNRRTHIRIALWVIGALLAVSLVANVVGNVSLGRRLADGSLSSGMLALVLAAVARVLRGLFVGALRMPEVHRFPAVAGNAAIIAERGSVLIELGGPAALDRGDPPGVLRGDRGGGLGAVGAHRAAQVRRSRPLAGRPGRLRDHPLALGPAGPPAPGRAGGLAGPGHPAPRRGPGRHLQDGGLPRGRVRVPGGHPRLGHGRQPLHR